MKETLILTENMHGWHLKDTRDKHISTFATLDVAQDFARENDYRLQIFPQNKKMTWFN